ncbi:MAG: rhomboid family intramembrane serine protease [Bacteroidota bacterium]
MVRMTEVVKNLIIINVLMFFGTLMLMGEPVFDGSGRLMDLNRGVLAMFYPALKEFQPFQLVTHMFMHADLFHLIFNMFMLYIFGSSLESLWGARRFLFFYFFSGFGALLLYLTIIFFEINFLGNPRAAGSWMMGASGAIMGVLAAFALKFPERQLMLIFPPIPVKAKYLALALIALDLFGGFGHFGSTGIAHFAHLGGVFAGGLLVLYWERYGSKL